MAEQQTMQPFEQFLREVQILGSRDSVRRLLEEDGTGFLEALGSIVRRIRETRGAAEIRIRTNSDRPPQVVVEFPVSHPSEAISLLAEFDRWSIQQPGQAHRRMIVDVYYQQACRSHDQLQLFITGLVFAAASELPFDACVNLWNHDAALAWELAVHSRHWVHQQYGWGDLNRYDDD